jgi:simple sugar transport system permease protein
MATFIKDIGFPRFMMGLLLIIILITALAVGVPLGMVVTDLIQRVGMYGIIVLAMVPSIQSGQGPNFAVTIGIVLGLLGATTAIELELSGMVAFLFAIGMALPLSVVVGYLYGKLLNACKGAEMTIATYTGFSIVQLMCIGWIILPFSSEIMRWPIGRGLKTTFTLEGTLLHVLDNFLYFEIGNVAIPTGLLLFFFAACLLVYGFTQSKMGTAIELGGMNNQFAVSSGVDIDRGRLVANIISTYLGAVGIIVYSQSFGFIQLYTAPLMMAFPAVAAVLIGGATATRAKVSHVIIGVILFQGVLTSSMPVLNEIIPFGSVAEISRMVIQNGIILYALTKVDGGQ